MKLTNWLQRFTLPTSNSTAGASKRRPATAWLGQQLETLESRVVLTATAMAAQAEQLAADSQAAAAAEVSAAAPPADAPPYIVSITPNFTTPIPVTTTSVTYTVTFSKPVKNVPSGNFVVRLGTSDPTWSITPVSDTVYTLTVSKLVPQKDSVRSPLIVFLNSDNTITDLEGRKLVGGASFSTQMNNTAFPSAEEAFTGDINGDGAPDLLTKTFLGYQYSLNNGQIVFSTPGSPSGIFSFDRVLALADVTGDGKADVITNRQGGGIVVKVGNGTGDFYLQQGTGAEDLPENTAQLGAVGDFNNDGNQDFAYVVPRAAGASAVRMALGTGNASQPFISSLEADAYSSTKTIRELVTADMNGDNKLDLVIRTDAGVEVALGNGNGGFTFASKNETLGALTDVAVGDLNADGNQDIAVAAATSPHVFYGDGTGALASPQRAVTKNVYGDEVSLPPRTLAIADLTGDRIQDLVWTTTTNAIGMQGSPAGLIRSLGVAGSLKPNTIMAMSDFDKDGIIDGVFLTPGSTPQASGQIYTVKGKYSATVNATPISLYTPPDAAPTGLNLSKTTVAENAKVGTVVGKLSAVDPDKKDTFTYTLVEGVGATDNASFAISGTNLTTKKVFDFEGQKTYSIRVEVADKFGRVFQKVFTITVTDATEPVTVPAQSFNVTEQSANGTVVGKVVGGGGKPGQAAQFAITSGNEFGYFAINATTGVITVAKGTAISQAKVAQHSLTVTATIAGKKPLSGSGAVTINVQGAVPELGVESITLTSGDPITTATATFNVKFTRSVKNVNLPNLTLVTTGGVIAGPITGISTSDNINYRVTVVGIDLETPGTLALKVTDPSNTLVTADGVKIGDGYSFTSAAYVVQDPTSIKPTVTSLNRGTNDPVTTESTQFTVTFSEPVTGVSSSNFVVVTTGGVIANAAVEVVRYSDTQYIATVTGIDFETAGTLGVNLVDPNGTIKSATNQTLNTALPFVGQTYNVQVGSATTPILLSILKSNHLPISGTTAEFLVTFNEPVTGVTAANFVANAGGGVTTDSTVEVTQVAGGSVYWVQITGIAKSGSGGTLKLDFYDFGGTKDTDNNGLPADYSYGGLEYSVV